MQKRTTSSYVNSCVQVLARPALVALAVLPLIGGCSRSFWDRSPAPRGQVQGIYAFGPLADVNADPTWKNPVLVGDPDGGSAAAAPSVPMPNEHDLAALAEVNRVRAQHGVPPVRFESKLYAAAYLHSQEQMRDGYLGHDSRDPQRATLGQRMQQQGYVGRTYAEVVAKDFPDARSVVAAWMGSPRHREVLLDPDLLEAAFARVDGPANRTNRWTGDFADPNRSSTPLPPPPAGMPVASQPAPQVPNPALRASVPPTAAPRTGLMQPARPAIPDAAAPAVAAQPRMVTPPQPQPQMPAQPTAAAPRTPSATGNIVPPPSNARAAAPAAPYVVPSQPRVVTQAPSQPRVATPQPSAPRTAQPSAPFVASTPRSTYVPPAPVQPYRPSAPRPRTKAKCGPGG